MKLFLLAGASLLAPAPAAASAQSGPADKLPDTPAPVPGTPSAGDSSDAFALPSEPSTPAEGAIDTLVEGDAAPAAAPPPPTGDPVIDRLNAMEAKIAALEARNKQLEDQAELNQGRLESVETRSSKAVQFSWGPTFSDKSGDFTFRPRGVIQIDYAGYSERAGGYDYSNGTHIRRGRFGFDGTALKNFAYRIEAEFVGNSVNLLDAYVSYTGIKNVLLTIGQQKAPYGLEANSSDSFNTFLERGMANNAFGAIGAERRVGATIAYVTDKVTATAGVFGAGEGVTRNALDPDEAYGVNGRVTWEPINEAGKVVHLGASSYWATNFSSATAADSFTVADRPNVRVDDGRLVSARIGGLNAAGLPTPGAKDAFYLGGEAAAVFGPFSLQGEYNRVTIDRYAAKSVQFDGFYVFGSAFLTGESRTFKNGVVDRLKPLQVFDPSKGSWGAWELALRYDQLDLTDRDLSSLDRKGTSWTGAVNWYLTGNAKILFNYIRFKGQNSPLVTTPISDGTTAKGDAFATRLHLDF
jgi:phosphate-selective porin OprO/OprP